MGNEYVWLGWPRITDFGTPVNWQLDADDEEQVEADVLGINAELVFVNEIIKRLDLDSKSNPIEVEKPSRILRRSSLWKRQKPNG